MKKLLSFFSALALIMSMAVLMSVNTFAEETKNIWDIGWKGNYGDGEFYVDTENYCGDSRQSIKLVNQKHYGYISAKMLIDVEPNTTYKFSAMVKYSDFKAEPGAENKKGAFICVNALESGHSYLQARSECTKSSKWKKLECTFTTPAKIKGDYILYLYNGESKGNCKGAAYFSDIKLEKAKLTNKWNMLAVVCKNVDAKAQKNGKIINYKNSIDNKGITYIKKILNGLDKEVKTMSEGLMRVADMDIVVIDEPISKLEFMETGGNCLTTDLDFLSEILDKYIKKNYYHQIIAIAPLDDVSLTWSGLGGGTYKNISFIQITYDAGFSSDESATGHIVHETLHYLNNQSLKYNPDTIHLHSYLNDKSIDTPKEKLDWYAKYMKDTLSEGDGIDPRAYQLPNGEWEVVCDDMSVTNKIVTAESSRIDISKCKVDEISDKTYSGKKRKPAVTVTDGSYTLKGGSDYTVSYSNNTNVGKAKVTIKGKGIYKGTITETFNIIPKSPAVKVKKSGDYIKLSWNEVKGADKYIIWQSKNGKDFKKLDEVDSDTLSKKIKYNKKYTYQFAVTVYNSETDTSTPYSYSDKI